MWLLVKRMQFVVVLFCILCLAGCKNNRTKLYLADAEALVETIELTHPAFSLNSVPERYVEAKESFLSKAINEMTYTEFVWSIKKYMASLNDGHSQVANHQVSPLFIDVNWQAIGEQLYLVAQDRGITNK